MSCLNEENQICETLKIPMINILKFNDFSHFANKQKNMAWYCRHSLMVSSIIMKCKAMICRVTKNVADVATQMYCTEHTIYHDAIMYLFHITYFCY